MRHSLTISTLLISSSIGLTLLSNHANASPSCYGVDEAGNTLDLSQLCQPNSEVNSLPSVPQNHSSETNIKPEENQGTEADEKPEISSREEGEKDLQACFSSPTCVEIMQGNNKPEKTPHQIRIDQVLNGGTIRPN